MSSLKGIARMRKAVLRKAEAASPAEELESLLFEKQDGKYFEEAEDGDPVSRKEDPVLFSSCKDPAQRKRWSQILAAASGDLEKFVVAAAEHIASTPEAFAQFESMHRSAIVRSVAGAVAHHKADISAGDLLSLSRLDAGGLQLAVRLRQILEKSRIDFTEEDAAEAVRLAQAHSVLES